MAVLAGIAIALLGLSGGLAVALVSDRDEDRERLAAPARTPTTAAGADGPLTDAELVERFGDAVWRVEVEGCGVTGTGSAFAIDEHHLVTNAHVVGVDPHPRLVSRDGEVAEGRVVGMTRDPDVAVIAVDRTLAPVLAWSDVDALAHGDHIIGLGYPTPGDFAATPGTVVSFRTEGGERVAIRTDAALDVGNSGGPALDQHGRVVGIVTQMDEEAEGFRWVPLVFTPHAVRDVVDDLRRSTTTVEPDCWWAEAVVPPPGWEVPDWEVPDWELPEWDEHAWPELPPPPEPELPEPPPAAPVPCPTGAPSATVTEVVATRWDPELLPEWWDVTVRGQVTNGASADIDVWGVDVTVVGDGSEVAYGITDVLTVAPGGSATFEAYASVASATRPSTGEVSVQWDWSSWEHVGCPRG